MLSVKQVFLIALCLIGATGVAGAAAGRLRVEPSAIELPAAGGEARLTLANRGDRPLRILRIDVTGDPAGLRVEPLQRTLAPGETAQLTVRREGPGATPAFAGLRVICDDETLPALPGGAPDERVGAVAIRAGATPLLGWLVFLPLLGALVILLAPGAAERFARAVGLVTTGGVVALAGVALARFDLGARGAQLVSHSVWIRALRVEWFVGVDGLSITMVALTALVGFIAALSSLSIDKNVKAYWALFLVLMTGMLGTFVALDLFLFYVFWEVMLLPMYFLIGLWGGPRKEYAAIKFFLYTLVGSVVMLLGVIALYYASPAGALVDGTPAAHTFDLVRLANEGGGFTATPRAFGFLGGALGFAEVVWVLFFIGFAIKVPAVPLHTWLPDAHVEAPTAISVILAGVLLKMGPYGLYRVNAAVLPGATRWAAPFVAVVGAVSIVCGALCAFAQKDLKRLVAYSSVSHMGFCLLGLGALTASGWQGAYVQLFNHGVITSMLFLLVGVLYDRAHTREIDRFGGVASQMPRYAFVFGLAFMASLGLPGLSGFIGEVLVLLGSFPSYRALTAVAATGVVLAAAYHLSALSRVQLGKWNAAQWKDRAQFPDLTAREVVMLAPLALLVVVLGWWPQPLVALSQGSLAEVLAKVVGGR
jgi:NADH-quinone oxidoreductase subunit M